MAVEVQIAQGRLESIEDRGVEAFWNVPYAGTTADANRFRPPTDAPSWDGVRYAASPGHISYQQEMPGVFGEHLTPPAPEGDECLNLNVWTPDPATSGMPVLVWIHGGAFYAGSGSDEVYNGSSFAQKGVVCVTINYRLGVQGFWHLADHFPELAQSGNLGMLDQIAALTWVQENIAAFGGDPSKVTIAGESAGGMSCSTLMAMPAAKGLFARAIPQSGAGHNAISAETATLIGGYMLESLGVAAGDTDALARCTNEQLVAAQTAIGMEAATTRNAERFREAAADSMAFKPTFGTEELPERPIDAVAAGSAADVALMTGTTLEESRIFIVELANMFDEATVKAMLDATFAATGREGAEALALYAKNRPGAAPHELVAAVETDRMFKVPAVRLADAQVQHNRDVWLYQFDWQTPMGDGEWGAHHALEIPFMFNQMDNPMAKAFVGTDPPPELVSNMHDAWVRFVTDGNPNHPGLPDWPRHNPDTRPTMLFNTQSEMVENPAAEELALWDEVL